MTRKTIKNHFWYKNSTYIKINEIEFYSILSQITLIIKEKNKKSYSKLLTFFSTFADVVNNCNYLKRTKT
jgi:hypothetical protein